MTPLIVVVVVVVFLFLLLDASWEFRDNSSPISGVVPFAEMFGWVS